MAVIGVMGGFAVGVAVGVAVGHHIKPTLAPASAPTPPAPRTPPTPAAPRTPPATAPVTTLAGGSATADNGAALMQLLNICIDQADRLRDQNEVLWRQFNSRLALVDVEVIVADGEPFDSERHDATGRETTTDASRHMTVASTELVGYRRNGQYLRRPKVVVYRADLDQDGTAN